MIVRRQVREMWQAHRGRKDGSAIAEARARLGKQPIADGDVWQSRMGQGAWRMSRHEFGCKAEFSGS
jgi:hypothetical protein